MFCSDIEGVSSHVPQQQQCRFVKDGKTDNVNGTIGFYHLIRDPCEWVSDFICKVSTLILACYGLHSSNLVLILLVSILHVIHPH